MENNFLGKDVYQEPSNAGNYFRFKDGLNQIRILTSAELFYEYFTEENKPVRSKTPFESTPNIKDDGRVKLAWAFVIWNYQEKKIQIMTITQSTIKSAIKALIDNPKWESPVGRYDIAITKSGEGLETKYHTQAEPPIEETSQEITDAFLEKTIDLNKLVSNDEPFAK